VVLRGWWAAVDPRAMLSTSVRSLVPRLAAAAAGLTVAALAFASPAAAAVGCDRFAATTGSDSAAGTETAPLRTVQALSDRLVAGQTGCLRGGTYAGALRVGRGGTAGAPVTLRSHPGERATILGRIHVARGADHVTFADLVLNGRNDSALPSPTVNAAHTAFRGNEVTNDRTGICFNLGNETWGRAIGTVIEGNRIHDCGRLPATNFDHGIYLSNSEDVRIAGNVIYDNADRGIQLYPDAQRTTIVGNVIDANGQGIIFSGAGGVASNDNVVERNVITNARLRYNVESYYPADTPPGRGNVVRRNCVAGGAKGDIMTSSGYSAVDNLTPSDPGYVNRAAKDFRLREDSPCRAVTEGALETAPLSGAGVDDAPVSEPVIAPVSSDPVVAAPLNTALPVISGTAQQGRVLSVSAGSWSNSPTGYAYQWQRCDGAGANCADVIGATGYTFTLTSSHVGYTMRVRVTAANAGGSTAAVSGQSARVLIAAPVNAGLPVISGTAQQGRVLKTSTGSWSNSPTGYAYQWRRCDGAGANCIDIKGATGSTFTLTSSHVGYTMRVRVTAANAGGSTAATSAQTARVTR
jgi:parallel beta-helix repeat protein